MMKKYVSLVLVAVLCTVTLLACGKEAKNDAAVGDQQETVEETQATEPQDTDEPEETESFALEQEYDSQWVLGAKLDNLDKEKKDVTELISSNKVTMLNFWGTFCGPCINEMPDLEALYQKNKDKGFGIVGMTIDIVDVDGSYFDDLIDYGKKIVKDTGVTYPVLITTSEMNDNFQMQAVPTTFIVDSEGKLLCDPIIGSQSAEDWQKIIDKYLD